MSEHTKEPWIVEYMGSDESDVVGASGVSIICGMSDADARRIVACVNALEGIPTELIEQGGFAAVPIATHREVKQQRDELLAALKEAIDAVRVFHGPEGWETYREHSPEMKRWSDIIARVEDSKP